MATFRDFAPHKNTIASRSTKVTFDRSSAKVSTAPSSGNRAFFNSGTYSPVNCPHKTTLRDLGLSRTVVIFSTTTSLHSPSLHAACHDISQLMARRIARRPESHRVRSRFEVPECFPATNTAALPRASAFQFGGSVFPCGAANRAAK